MTPFSLRGVIEGFYGAYFTFPERNDLIRFLGKNGFNTYVYGPKNDRQHRMRWREPYPPAILDRFDETIRIARRSGITFCYAISFGVPLKYVSSEAFEVMTDKLRTFFDRGCRSFAVFLDDVPAGGQAGVDADCCNRLYDWVSSLDGSCSLSMCPTQYHGRPPFGDYLYELGKALHPDIDMFYTGPEVCSSEITLADVTAFAEAAGRPPLIWDNYPVNDGEMRFELHLGPLRGRDPSLHQVCRGFLSNLMNQAEASKIALLTVAGYLNDPRHYDPDSAWQRALLAATEPSQDPTRTDEESAEALRRFAENSLSSCLQQQQAPEMDRLVSQALAALRSGTGASQSKAVAALSQYLTSLDESTYHLKNRMPNLALRRDLLPWIEALDEKIGMGRAALLLLTELDRTAEYRRSPTRTVPLGEANLSQSLTRALEARVAEVRQSPKRIGGTALFTLADYALERGGEQSAISTQRSALSAHQIAERRELTADPRDESAGY